MMASPLQRHSDSGSAASHRSNSIELAHIAEPHRPVLRHSQPYHTGGGCQYAFPPRCRRSKIFSMQPTHGENSMSEMKLKVSEKGGVSLYGLGRFPVTLYAEQWQKLLGEVENIKKFLEDNKALLKTKDAA
jgi:hypothetical protein